MALSRRAFLANILKGAPAAAALVAAPKLLLPQHAAHASGLALPEPKKLYRGYSADELARPTTAEIARYARMGVMSADEARGFLGYQPLGDTTLDLTLVGQDGGLTAEFGKPVQIHLALGGIDTVYNGVVAQCQREIGIGGLVTYKASVALSPAQAGAQPVTLNQKHVRQLALNREMPAPLRQPSLFSGRAAAAYDDEPLDGRRDEEDNW